MVEWLANWSDVISLFIVLGSLAVGAVRVGRRAYALIAKAEGLVGELSALYSEFRRLEMRLEERHRNLERSLREIAWKQAHLEQRLHNAQEKAEQALALTLEIISQAATTKAGS